MKYWDEMLEKYGFDDGDSQPADCWACRYVYVTAVNALAARFGSGVRAVAFDRQGMHNSCLIEVVPEGRLVGLTERQIAGDPTGFDDSRNPEIDWTPAEWDEAFERAVQTVEEADVDDAVLTRVEVTLTPQQIVASVLRQAEETA